MLLRVKRVLRLYKKTKTEDILDLLNHFQLGFVSIAWLVI